MTHPPITFRLSDREIELLRASQQDGESLNQTAARLLRERLGTGQDATAPTSLEELIAAKIAALLPTGEGGLKVDELVNNAVDRAIVEPLKETKLYTASVYSKLLARIMAIEALLVPPTPPPSNDDDPSASTGYEQLTFIENSDRNEVTANDEAPPDESPAGETATAPSINPAPSVPTEPDRFLQNLYGMVLVKQGKIEQFWTGKSFTLLPVDMKIYKSRPNKRVRENAESAARAFGGEAKYNDAFSLLKLMGYPHDFGLFTARKIEWKWLDSNLIQ